MASGNSQVIEVNGHALLKLILGHARLMAGRVVVAFGENWPSGGQKPSTFNEVLAILEAKDQMADAWYVCDRSQESCSWPGRVLLGCALRAPSFGWCC